MAAKDLYIAWWNLENLFIRFPAMEQGKYKTPKRFGRPSNGDLDPEGYSDHFPVGVRVGM